MQVTEQDIARIPRGNVRAPVAEFARVWIEAERRCEVRGVQDWRAAGVAMTCRWMGAAIVRPEDGRRWYPAKAPVTHRNRTAYEELIEAEFLAAEKLDLKRPRPEWLSDQAGWIEGVCATLRWAWRRSGPVPLQLDTAEQR